MTEKRAKELITNIIEDKDNGAAAVGKATLSECIYLVASILPKCMNEADKMGKDTDASYFAQMIDRYRPFVVDKLKKAGKLWVVYCEATGYPYSIDKEILVLFDHANHNHILDSLKRAGYAVTLLEEDPEVFMHEIGHMYRNGFKAIRLTDGRCEALTLEREEIYGHELFYNDDYITNPAFQEAMISFFQEFRKYDEYEINGPVVQKREEKMIRELINAEFMVPCIKTETEEEVEISHPYIDMSQRIESEDGKPVIAIPAFTDGYELEKCYEGKSETMLYSFKELTDLIKELGANGIVFNFLGISYYMEKAVAKRIVKDKELR